MLKPQTADNAVAVSTASVKKLTVTWMFATKVSPVTSISQRSVLKCFYSLSHQGSRPSSSFLVDSWKTFGVSPQETRVAPPPTLSLLFSHKVFILIKRLMPTAKLMHVLETRLESPLSISPASLAMK